MSLLILRYKVMSFGQYVPPSRLHFQRKRLRMSENAIVKIFTDLIMSHTFLRYYHQVTSGDIL
jgi:hypothetical protein